MQAAVGDAYRIQKELGRGWMSRPFRATEAPPHCQIERFSIDTLIDMPAHAGVRVSLVVKRKAGAA